MKHLTVLTMVTMITVLTMVTMVTMVSVLTMVTMVPQTVVTMVPQTMITMVTQTMVTMVPQTMVTIVTASRSTTSKSRAVLKQVPYGTAIFYIERRPTLIKLPTGWYSLYSLSRHYSNYQLLCIAYTVSADITQTTNCLVYNSLYSLG